MFISGLLVGPFYTRTIERHGPLAAGRRLYFHNCLYKWVWRDNRRRFDERIPTAQLLHTFGAYCKVVLVGDATMSPYGLVQVGGAVEHWNEEPGAKWLARVRETWRHSVWLNPQPEDWWAPTRRSRSCSGSWRAGCIPSPSPASTRQSGRCA